MRQSKIKKIYAQGMRNSYDKCPDEAKELKKILLALSSNNSEKLVQQN